MNRWNALNRWSDNVLKDIVEAQPLRDYCIQIGFEDGVTGVVDVRRLVDFTGVFEPRQRNVDLTVLNFPPPRSIGAQPALSTEYAPIAVCTVFN